MPVIIRLTTRVAMASSLVWRLNSAHQLPTRAHQLEASLPAAAAGDGGVLGTIAPIGARTRLGATHLVPDISSVLHAVEVHLL